MLERYVANHDEGNVYVRLVHVLSRLGRKDDARDVYEKGVRQRSTATAGWPTICCSRCCGSTTRIVRATVVAAAGFG